MRINNGHITRCHFDKWEPSNTATVRWRESCPLRIAFSLNVNDDDEHLIQSYFRLCTVPLLCCAAIVLCCYCTVLLLYCAAIVLMCCYCVHVQIVDGIHVSVPQTPGVIVEARTTSAFVTLASRVTDIDPASVSAPSLFIKNYCNRRLVRG